MSTVSDTHPLYAQALADWTLMRHASLGDSTVKSRGTTYLPSTAGMRKKGMGTGQEGYEIYQAYLMRALFPELVQRGVQTLVGLLNRGDTTIDLPPQLEPMRENATPNGEGLAALLRKMHEELFITGRLGLLGDVRSGQAISSATPMIGVYPAENIINWDDGKADDGEQVLNLVVLDESEPERKPNEFAWEDVSKYRVIVRGPVHNVPANTVGSELVRDTKLQGFPPSFNIPQFANNTLKKIPFVFVNSTDLVPAPDKPPLLGLGTRSMAIYRSEADLRWSLFMQGQDTLWIKGEPPTSGEPELGAGSVIYSDAANFIGVSAAGLGHMIAQLQEDYIKAGEAGAQILDKVGASVEAHETLRLRIASRTTTLVGVARVAAEGLQDILRQIAVWVGADPAKVVVIPSLDFAETESLQGTDLLNFVKAKIMGFPLSQESLHRIARDRNMTELTFEEEKALIDAEDPLAPGGPGVPGDEDDDEGVDDDRKVE